MRSLTLSFSLFLAACGVDHSNTDAGTDTAASASGGYSFGSTGSSGGSSDTDATDTDTEDTDSDTDATDTDATDTDTVDTDCDESTWYADNDGDGYGSAAYTLSSCDQPTGYVSNGNDLDDSIAAVHDVAQPARICTMMSGSTSYDLWWADDTSGDYGASHWGTSTVTGSGEECETVSDFRPTHDYVVNGWWNDGRDRYIAEAGNMVNVTYVYIVFADNSGDIYTLDTTGTHLGETGYASYEANSDGGGNLVIATHSDFVGAY